MNSLITWVYTHDLAVAAMFYGEALGLEVIRDEGSAKIFKVSNNASIGVCTAFEDRVVEPRGGMISIVTDDVDAWYQRLCDKNIEVEKAPHVLEQFGIYTFFVDDPNGYVVEFQQFL
ncbi:MAG: VOC family protein [Pseudomonadota bacterium]